METIHVAPLGYRQLKWVNEEVLVLEVLLFCLSTCGWVFNGDVVERIGVFVINRFLKRPSIGQSHRSQILLRPRQYGPLVSILEPIWIGHVIVVHMGSSHPEFLGRSGGNGLNLLQHNLGSLIGIVLVHLHAIVERDREQP